jgi:hypothetical protein
MGLIYTTQTSFYLGALDRISAGTTALLLYLAPAFVVAYSALLGRRTDRVQIVAVVVPLSGLAVIVGVPTAADASPTGLLFGAAAGAVFGSYALAAELFFRDVPAQVIAAHSMAVSSFRLSAFGFVLPASCFRLSTAYCRLPTSDFRLPASGFSGLDRSPSRWSRRPCIGRMNPPLPGAAGVGGGVGDVPATADRSHTGRPGGGTVGFVLLDLLDGSLTLPATAEQWWLVAAAVLAQRSSREVAVVRVSGRGS